MSAAVIALAPLTGCTAAAVPVEASGGPSERAERGGERDTLQPLPVDRVALRESGTGPFQTPIMGAYGPHYILYARCEGKGELRVVDRKLPGFAWAARCDGVPSRVQVEAEIPETELLVDVGSGVEWEFLVAQRR